MQSSLCQATLNSNANPKTVGLSATVVAIADENRDRVAIIFGRAASDYWVWCDRTVAVGNGVPVLATGDGPIVIDLHRYGDLVRRPWYGVAAGALVVPVAEAASNEKG